MLFDDLEGWDGRRGRRLKREGIYKLYISIYIYLCGEGNGNPLQYSCLEKPVDRGAWWADVHGVAQSWTQLKRLRMHACMPWRRNWQPTPVFLPGESQGQRSLVGCRLWGLCPQDLTHDFLEGLASYWLLSLTLPLGKIVSRDFPGHPVVKTLCSQCRGHTFDPCLRTKDPTGVACPKINK